MSKSRNNYKDEYRFFIRSLLPKPKQYFLQLCDSYSKKLLSEKQNPKILDYLKDPYRSDVRTPEEYLYDLNEGWLFEDFIYTSIFGADIPIRFVSEDSNREVVGSRRIYNSPDFEIIINNKIYKIQYKYAKYFFKNLNIKPSRFDKHQDYFVLFHIISKNKFFIFNPREHAETFPIKKNPNWNGKECYNIPTDELGTHLKLFSLKELPDYLKQLGSSYE